MITKLAIKVSVPSTESTTLKNMQPELVSSCSWRKNDGLRVLCGRKMYCRQKHQERQNLREHDRTLAFTFGDATFDEQFEPAPKTLMTCASANEPSFQRYPVSPLVLVLRCRSKPRSASSQTLSYPHITQSHLTLGDPFHIFYRSYVDACNNVVWINY